MYLIGEMAGMLATGHRTEVTGSRTGPGQRGRERRLPVRAVLALGACPGREVPLTGGPPRDHGADGAPAPRLPVPQHPEGPAGGTRARGR
jgi:hypothetical protein